MVSYKSINHLGNNIHDREQMFAGFEIDSRIPHVKIQTCNRMEIYQGEGVIPEEVARHLYRVVAGLESGLIGESAIQGQVKTAYEDARSKYKLSPALHKLFQEALRVGKKVRSESGIGRGAVSHGQVTVELIAQSGINLKDAIITLIGVNKLTEDTIRFLQNKGASTIFVANRSYHKALPYAEKFGCQIHGFEHIREILSLTDVLISATSASHLIIKEGQVEEDKKMMIFDLAFPRDVDEKIGLLPGVKLYNLEDVERSIQNNMGKRQNLVLKAEEIIESELIKKIENESERYKYKSSLQEK